MTITDEARDVTRTPTREGGTAVERERLARHHGRLQGFSDGVFALAATLLVVTLQVPDSYEALLEAIAGFPAFALGFAAILSLWTNHRHFFARYPLGDGWTVTINSVLLFVVLLYVYPLKLFAEVVAGYFLGSSPDVLASMGTAEVRGLFVMFSIGVLTTMLVFVALHARAWHLRDVLGLDAPDRLLLRGEQASYLAVAALALLSVVIAALGVGIAWGMPGWPYLLAPAISVAIQATTARRLRAA